MASTRVLEVEREPPVVVTNTARPGSRLPRSLRFPIFVALTFFLRGLLNEFASEYIGEELSLISKTENEEWQPFALLGYKVLLLWFTWKANYDYVDITALTTLANAPYAYLLSTYYGMSTLTVAAFWNIEVLSIALPTYLLRGSAAYHRPNAPVRNRFLLESFQVQTSTALLAIAVYVTALWSALQTGIMNLFLISHFDIPTMELAHDETVVSIVVKVITAGIAARTFLLNPSIGAQTVSGTVTPTEPFEPAKADLSQHIEHNLKIQDKRKRTLVWQTMVASVFMFTNTVQRILTLKETDLTGASGYAGGWVFATWILSAWWTWVGNTEVDD